MPIASLWLARFCVQFDVKCRIQICTQSISHLLRGADLGAWSKSKTPRYKPCGFGGERMRPNPSVEARPNGICLAPASHEVHCAARGRKTNAVGPASPRTLGSTIEVRGLPAESAPDGVG